MHLRAEARAIFHEAIRAVELRSALRDKLGAHGKHLHIEGTAYDLSPFHRILLVALGKAAVPMAEVLVQALQPLLHPSQTFGGLVLGTTVPEIHHPRLIYRLGTHPLPGPRSFAAAQEVLDLLHAHASPDTFVFFLISGGASAMIEAPLDPSVSLHELTAFHQVLVHSGLPITAMNTLRKHVSAVKGGRLALAAGAATQCTLLVSDVPPTQPDFIASGPTLPDPTTLQDCRNLLRNGLAYAPVPQSIRALLEDPRTPETPKPGDATFSRASAHLMLSSDDLCRAALRAAEARGFTCEVDLTPDDWPFEGACDYLLSRLQALSAAHPTAPVCLVTTGEIAVQVGTPAGMGGRNGHFALYAATAMATETQHVAVLSAGSDGMDGNSPAAGAVTDNTTGARAAALGLDAAHALAAFDSYPLLDALGDTIITGPTGNNLRDLRLLLLLPAGKS